MTRTTLLIAGDWAPIRAFDSIIRKDTLVVYGDMLPVIRAADVRIVNCECAFTTETRAVWKSGSVFKGLPEHVTGLSEVPFEVACLGNNHVMDYGVAGLRQTLSVLKRVGVKTVGAGLTPDEACAPLSMRVNRTPVHIVNFSEGEDLTTALDGPGVFGWDIYRACETVARCKKKGGIVVAIGHCGLEYVPFPPPYVCAAFRALAHAGADCVVGHHPHVPQGIEWHDGVPLLYSLGNFVFYQPTNLHYRRTGFCVSLRFNGSKLDELELHPYSITDEGLRALPQKQAVAFGKGIQRISRPFEKRGGDESAWEAYLAYYGAAGFRSEVQGILDRLDTEPQKAAAMFRNRITTPQHVALWRDYLTRVVKGEKRPYPAQAMKMVEEYFSRTQSESH